MDRHVLRSGRQLLPARQPHVAARCRPASGSTGRMHSAGRAGSRYLPSREGGIAMRVGLHYWNYSTPADPAKIAATLAETARIAEQGGVSTFSVMDHYFQM